jgi:hypothetical protein
VTAASIITALMMEAASTSEMSVNFYQTTWNYNPEDSHLQNTTSVVGSPHTNTHYPRRMKLHLLIRPPKNKSPGQILTLIVVMVT